MPGIRIPSLVVDRRPGTSDGSGELEPQRSLLDCGSG